MVRRLVSVYILSVLMLLSIGCSKKSASNRSSDNTGTSGISVPEVVSVQVRDNKVPNFSWKDASGKTIDLDSYRGKVTVINFWATWCGPCIHEIPDLIELSKELSDKNVKLIGVSLDRGPNVAEDVQNFVTEKGIPYQVVLANEELENAFGNISSIPTTFLVDDQGTIRQTIIGIRTKRVLIQAVTDLL